MSYRECVHRYYCIMYCKIIAKIEILPFSPSRRSNGLYKPCQDAVLLLGTVLKVWRVEFPRDDATHWKWTRAIITKLQLVRWKEATGASLKHFESGCYDTEGVCTFNTTNEYMEASKVLIKAQARSGLGVLFTLFHKSY